MTKHFEETTNEIDVESDGHTYVEKTPYGFIWEQAVVERRASVKWRKGEKVSHKVLRISAGKKNLDIYISPTGRSVRVYDGQKELT